MPPVHRRRLGHPARATLGSQLIAQSADTVRVDRRGEAPLLLWPESDVRLDRISVAERSSISLAWPEPTPGTIALDPERVHIDVVDTMGGADERDVSTKRFPTWGDLDDLIDVMDIRPSGGGRYVSVTRSDWRRPVVEGSQMLGQAVVAAGKHVPDRRVVSAHMIFARVATTEAPLEFLVDEISSGRTMSTLRLDVVQSGRRCATGTLLLDVTAPDVIRHSVPAPDGPGPYDSPALDMSVTGRDVRVVGGGYDDSSDAPAEPPVIDSWVRFRSLPTDHYMHAGLLVHYTGHMSIATALRPHPGVGQRAAHRTLSTAVNAISVALHADAQADEWMLYHHLSTFAGDGMTHSECRVHDAGGGLIASFSADCMVRNMPSAVGISHQSVL